MSGPKALARFIRWVMRDVTYLGTYPATVMAQVGETCDVRTDSDKIGKQGGFSGLPLRHGLPGTSVQVAPGARILVAFDNGDPEKPYVALWENATALSLVFVNGTMPVARVGDQVAIQATAGSYPVVGIGTIMAGQPLVKA
jgi:hypothetical protein